MHFVFPVLILFVMRYLWVRLHPSFPGKYRWWGAFLFVFALVSSFIYRLLPDDWMLLGAVLVAVGSFFLVFAGNWFLVCVVLDLYLGVRRVVGAYSKRANRAFRLRWLPLSAKAVVLASLLFFVIGVPTQWNFLVRRVEIPIQTPLSKPLRLAVLTDIHFDLMFPRSKLAALVDTLKVLQPDAVFFVGDLSDISATELQKKGLDSLFREIRAPLGFWGVTGNHEAYINPEGGTLVWARNNGLTLLHDSTACTEFFCVSGRLDHQYARRHGPQRVSLPQLQGAILEDKPWLVLDHQPKGLTPEDLNVLRLPDLVLSGHTHAGQFFPWNLVIGWVWRLPEGFGVLDGVPWYVSSGFGQWGPPIRVGTRSELVLLTLKRP